MKRITFLQRIAGLHVLLHEFSLGKHRKEKTMSPLSMYSRLLKSISASMLIAGLTAAQTLAPAGPKRPATVPADYVITPFGYFHPSCVTHLANGDVVRQDENAIQHADGVYENIPACTYAHFKASGEQVTGDERAAGKQPTISHAWVEYASTTTNTSFGYLLASWSVPTVPYKNDGQTVFLFPGVEDYSDVVTIIQPVLGWNSDFASAWGIASWNCCKSGTVFEATPTRVNSGDTIIGEMFPTCGPGILSCGSWDIMTEDLESGNRSLMLNTSSQGQTFNWAFAGVLEVYNIVQCEDYPADNSTSFHDLLLEDYNKQQIASPSWSVTNLSSGLTPVCGYGGSLPQQVTLIY
jgi:hypothetical protein